ncbi:MAG: glutathione S-transferase [Blastomonas sp. CACIA14H2]|jgi:glutathione S-transferase|uniref:glutathione S-transferase family protein n=1 Tax=unclassified Blastomonas TaxID=2626550 RepID=UPI0003CFD221|nr:glutathione S-transferase family protein [Blastomonas sp. UPD001]ESZ86549.1 MAG: glutathione S-transferase [Blastomonas sp. CACIA14H2]MBL0965929.1 glutathione S-transferase family protein [Blastomonas sp.]
MSIVLHHLEYSRSTRVIWLLEEMGTPYEMVRHQRDPQTFRAPPGLAEVHPLSKAPTVIVDGHVMVESGAIIEYLIERFGSETLAPANAKDRPAYLEWLHFAEGTMASPIIFSALAPRFGGLGPMLGGFMGAEVTKLLDHVERAVTGHDYLVGDRLSGADINMAYLLEVATASKQIGDRPNLIAYLERLRARPAYQKSIEIGGPMIFAAISA